MRIDLRQPYESITTLTTVDLPDFALLIGRNGAGKTQLLEALRQRVARVPGIAAEDIELYDMVSFRSPNTNSTNRQANHFAQITADAYLSLPQARPPVEVAAALFAEAVTDIERESGTEAREEFELSLRREVRHMPDLAVFAADAQGSPYKGDLYEQVLAPLNKANSGRQRRGSSGRPNNSFDGNQAALLSAAMRLTDKLPHELTRGDIIRASHSEGGTLSNSISEVFTAYKADQFIWAHKRIEKEHIRFDELIAEYRAVNPPPWETLREILSEMRDAAGDQGLFDFEFSDPEDYQLDMGNFASFRFRATMTNRTTGTQYELDSLSSGEKVLMALCLVSFNQYLGRRRPKLLLLDELDAVLHPSMVAALVSTLKTQFVSQGTQVLMTSHSPMTVAALDEADIFSVVRTGGHVEVSRITKSKAIAELSEGLATIDTGLRIAAYDEAKVTILSEGNNAKHLKRWVELNFPNDVRVFEDLGEHTNDGQLLDYGRLLGRVNTNTHFVVVWDCDAASKAKALRDELPRSAKVTPYAFPKRPDNKIAQRGIENNYDEEILEPYSNMTTRGDGTLVARSFPSDSKTEFADHVLQEGSPEYFINFQGLRDLVSEILEPSNQSPGLDAAKAEPASPTARS